MQNNEENDEDDEEEVDAYADEMFEQEMKLMNGEMGEFQFFNYSIIYNLIII